MVDVTKLKMGDRVQFANKTFAYCGAPHFETEISKQKGTVVNFSKNDWDNPNTDSHVWIKLDIKHEEFDCDEWGNSVQFNLSSADNLGGTSVDYLKKAKLIEEQD